MFMPHLPLFCNASLLRYALTHRSYINEHPLEKSEDNERLEFLGDAVLNFLSAEFLYHHYPKIREGELSRLRSLLVNNKQLSEFAIALDIGKQMRLGRGAVQDRGRQSESLLSSTFEAIVGAYFLDSGIDAVRIFVQPFFTSIVERLPCSGSDYPKLYR